MSDFRFRRHKLRMPPVGAIKRSAVLDRIGDASITVLHGGPGYGKSTVAAQLAARTSGPTVWYTADELDTAGEVVSGYVMKAISEAWPETGFVAPARNAIEQLRYMVDELVGPGCIVLDALHTVDSDELRPVLDALIAALPPDLRLVLASDTYPPVDILADYASGRAVRLGAEQLVLTADELESHFGVQADAIADETGGWPLAVGLVAAGEPGPQHVVKGFERCLTEQALADVDEVTQSYLALLARLPAFPDRVLVHLPDVARTGVALIRKRHPSLLRVGDDGWTTLAGALRRHLSAKRVDVDPWPIAATLGAHDPVLAARLLVAGSRCGDAAFPAGAEPYRGVAMAAEALLGETEPTAAIAALERDVSALRERGRADLGATLRLLAQLRLESGDPHGALRACTEVEQIAEARGSARYSMQAKALGALARARIDEIELADQIAIFERLWTDLLAHETHLGMQFACAAAHHILDRDPDAHVSIWVTRARGSGIAPPAPDRWFTALEARANRDPAALQSIISRREDEGRAFDVPRLRRYLHDLCGRHVDATAAASATTEFSFLGPRVQVSRAEDVIKPSGYGAQVLAVLAAEDGVVARDRLIDRVWPDADATAGRNRLYMLLSRLRKSLGIADDGILYSADGLVHLDPSANISVDIWEFRHLAAQRRFADAVFAYTGSFCSKQFAYEDFAIETRRELDAEFVRVAMAALDETLGADTDGEAAADLALHISTVEPDDDELVLACAFALDSAGAAADAAHILDRRVAALEDLGLPADNIRSEGAALREAAISHGSDGPAAEPC